MWVIKKRCYRGKVYEVTNSEVNALRWSLRKGIDWYKANHKESFKKFKKLGLIKNC